MMVMMGARLVLMMVMMMAGLVLMMSTMLRKMFMPVLFFVLLIGSPLLL
jgi:hypothetical protein